MFDVVKGNPVYKEMMRNALTEGREEGLKEGLEKGRKQGRKEALEQTLMDLLAERFPRLVRFVRKQTSDVDDPALLRLLVLKVSTAQTAEEARERLISIIEAYKDQDKE